MDYQYGSTALQKNTSKYGPWLQSKKEKKIIINKKTTREDTITDTENMTPYRPPRSVRG